MRRPLPNIEHVARALLVQGAREAAIDLMEAAVARGGEDRTRCEALLRAVRSRPQDRVIGPPLALDAALVETLASHGRLVEAWAVARGASVGNSVAGVEIAEALGSVMEPAALDDPWRSRWTEIVATGSLAGVGDLERAIIAGQAVPAVLVERLRLARRLLRGYWTPFPAEEEAAAPLPADCRELTRQRLRARDLIGALAAIRGAVDRAPSAAPVAMALARLIAATERLLVEEGPSRNGSTLPLEGPGLALLQVRMGNFDEAERAFRFITVERPADHLSRDRLADIVLVRRAIDDSAAPTPDDAVSRTPSPDWLNKRVRKASVEGWASTTKARTAPSDWSGQEEESTSVLRADEEAELHVKAGAPEKAVPIYRGLVAKYPDRPRFRSRLAEIEAMTEGRQELAETLPLPQNAPSVPEVDPALLSFEDATLVVSAVHRATTPSTNPSTSPVDETAKTTPPPAGPLFDEEVSTATGSNPWDSFPRTEVVTVRRIVRVG